MIDCRRASELVSQSWDRPLTRREKFGLRFHLLICAACRRFERQLALMNRVFKRGEECPPEPMPVEVKGRLAERLDRAIQASTPPQSQEGNRPPRSE
ncbi:MAG: hypothetical protein COX57_01345 [Alphaproteobacteria bacterium CG_4_10_14_0_2_um_filter_63_37]|nr:MAG: hypothetical protein COX57_01345 [Alphaproteobacteria bacterium CG_4_10_14_0_2_um_filter_63_37]